jgi:hypothetical protein
MDRRVLLASGLSLLAAKALAQDNDPTQTYPNQTYPNQGYPPQSYPDPGYPPPQQPQQGYPQQGYQPPPPRSGPQYPANTPAQTYSRDELVNQVSDFFGVTAEAAGAVITHVFNDNGRPTGYIAGEEASGAFGVGLRYGKGLLYMKNRRPEEVFWQGPSFGWDVGGNASRNFTLCYNIQRPDEIFQRFPGVEGTAYLIGGMGVNYQRSDTITLAPIRAGLGLRLGANLGYLAYSRTRHILPF